MSNIEKITQHKVFFNGEPITEWREGVAHIISDPARTDDSVVYSDGCTIIHREFVLLDDVIELVKSIAKGYEKSSERVHCSRTSSAYSIKQEALENLVEDNLNLLK